MNRNVFPASVVLACTLLSAPAVFARTFATVDGYSDGVALSAQKGPGKINRQVKASKAGGTIQTAVGRARFTASRVDVGAQVTSRLQHTDASPTHVRAGGVYFGIARVVSDTLDDGEVIRDFHVDLRLHGGLSCVAEVPDAGWALAQVEAYVLADGAQRFYGNGTYDAFSGFDGGIGNFSGRFTQSGDSAAIDQTLSFSLGDVVVGQPIPFLFSGATLVSYGADVFVDHCTADFLHTDTLMASPQNADHGSFAFTEAQPVKIFFQPNSFNRNAPPATFKVYVEADAALLDHIDAGSVKLFSRVGNGGVIPATALEARGDGNGNGRPDRAALFDVSLLNYLLLDNQAEQAKQTLTLVGTTDDGVAFIGKRALPLEH